MKRLAVFAVVASSLVAGLSVSAQTAPPAAVGSGGREAMAACRDDMKALCGGVDKGGGRKIACLKENQAKLSTRCQSAIQGVLDKRGLGQAAVGAGVATSRGKLKKVCQIDIATHCADVANDHGKVGKCLQDKATVLSPPCQVAVADARAKAVLRQQAKLSCGVDAPKLCPGLNGKDLMACLQSNVQNASPGCQQALGKLPVPNPKAAAKP